jgi:hypothetical protein
MSSPTALTPVRDALCAESELQAKVMDGLGAMKPNDKSFIEPAIRSRFQDSLDTDQALIEEYRHDHRFQKVTQVQTKLSQHGITFVGRQVMAKHLP